MSNHLLALLNTWYPMRKDCRWVLATLYETEGSSYRKPGAHMMVNDLGQYFGLLSGGCLEADILREAKKVWAFGSPKCIEYDLREDDELGWQLGIGCGGLVKILLQPLEQANHFLCLEAVRSALNDGQSGIYEQRICENSTDNRWSVIADAGAKMPCKLAVQKDKLVFSQWLSAPIHLAVFGGGVDAQPVVSIAHTLGWKVTLLDPRTSYARRQDFITADSINKSRFEDMLNQMDKACLLSRINAAIVMTHNVKLDALALQILQCRPCRYVGLLGPTHRTEKVLASAALQSDALHFALSNPMGLGLGGELPESIALSVLSEIHAVLLGNGADSVTRVSL